MSESLTTPTARPRAARHILALILLGAVAAVCVALGRWQLDRAQLRRDLQHSITQGRARPPLTLAAATPGAQLQAWRRVRARGVWRNDLTVLLDNRNQDGRPGYWVAAPLVLQDALVDQPAVAVLVLRGWVARSFDASLPTFFAPQDDQVEGQLLDHVPQIYELPSLWGKARNAHNPQMLDYAGGTPVVTNLTLADATRSMGLALLPVVLQQLDEESNKGNNNPVSPDGLIRAWAGPSLDADKNVGYAVQWFSFATIAVLAALMLAWRLWGRAVLRRGMQK